MPSHYNQQNQQNDNPIIRKFYAESNNMYRKPNGTFVMTGEELHEHADGTIMTLHTMGVNDNSVVVTPEQLNEGGILQGPSHEEGGIPAIVAGTDPIELEGGEYIVNAQTVDAVGKQFLDELNSTQTSYHQGGYEAGQLPSPSQFKNGGKVVKRNNIRRTKPVPTRRKGGNPIQNRVTPKKMGHGGMHQSCPAGMMMNASGGCVPMSSSSGYRTGGNVSNKRKMQAGGVIPMNSEVRTNQIDIQSVRKGSVPKNAVGGNTRKTRGGPTGQGRHQHRAIMDNSGNGHTASHIDGHVHKIVNSEIKIACPPGIGCHSHSI